MSILTAVRTEGAAFLSTPAETYNRNMVTDTIAKQKNLTPIYTLRKHISVDSQDHRHICIDVTVKDPP